MTDLFDDPISLVSDHEPLTGGLLEEFEQLRAALDPLRLSGAAREAVDAAHYDSNREMLRRLRGIAINHGIYFSR